MLPKWNTPQTSNRPHCVKVKYNRGNRVREHVMGLASAVVPQDGGQGLSDPVEQKGKLGFLSSQSGAIHDGL